MLKYIKINKLFGSSEILIDLENSGDIKVLVGRNGCGKSTILKIIDYTLTGRHFLLNSLPFESVELETKDNYLKISLIRSNLIPFDEERSLGNVQVSSHNIQYIVNGDELDLVKCDVNEFVPSLRDIVMELEGSFVRSRNKDGIIGYRDRDSDAFYSEEDRVRLYYQYQEILAKTDIIPDKVLQIISNLRVNTIYTDRLSVSNLPSSSKKRLNASEYQTVISEYVDHINLKLRSLKLQYAAESQKIDRSAPARFIEALKDSGQNDGDWLKIRDDFNEDKKRLADLGLFDDVNESDGIAEYRDEENTDQLLKSALTEYFKSLQKKIEVLKNDPYLEKLELFKEIFNRKIKDSFKELLISYEDGIFISNSNLNITIEFNSLSSGEQHTFIQLFKLIFEIDNDSIILVDEPELSLHVIWLRNFVNDIRSINKGKNSKVIIATHSPLIVSSVNDEDIIVIGN